MKVNFACSTAQIDKYKENYILINSLISELGHTLVRDWIDVALEYTDSKKSADKCEKLPWKEVFHEVSKAVLACDAVVFEATVPSFSIGYQISLAIERRKPVLILWSEDSQRDLKDSFISGLDSDLITMRKYNKTTLKDIMILFFRENESGGEKIRFNFFIDKKLEKYLDWASYNYKKSKADILRESIQDRITYQDDKYKDYLDVISK
ncbi:hypothetical protein A3K34_02440 [candidate division WWE3 bacterium RIFOXYC1_FULL_40_10]|uniref:Nucleoside 2-deoxyribosyltransferase n=1 Tax=candidate division WWE3 bacterium RIFOXYA2_FULL_46_9 TaxID=1802636 RepID=A0A1F4W3U1_UNCKA|nr:MAG: hypothetical protein A3K58_02440 [candidate division WWE3 bacterium RIFOXYB1_FULL_40_22]OGC61709.1 MAG: hypothetical protein A3K37_02440 [candidate division WWE3 bacterium RIFOXYA1_FULL_40_11]OGC63693.1 MAG: hypothetical protein A2264_04930 [candidate division WWE3 bacterium RIFOXYA2_FULL_46_9]OGC64883.1 MAG: hypothetical protein A2326_01265 [candidate division WWE3 bacterium RIFOXYB2_FULL_41_6]OGC66092.1 MAG: hypothetical protein A3K34_02440 [candidate division WWE3 bacterium RIFOXYC1_